MHAAQALEFSLPFLAGRFGQAGIAQHLLVFPHLQAGFVFVFPQLLLDGLELLAQKIIPLAPLHIFAHLFLDLGAHFQDFQLIVDQAVHLFQPAVHIHQLHHLLLFPHRGIDGGGHHVGQDIGLLEGFDHLPHLRGKRLGQAHDLFILFDDIGHQGPVFHGAVSVAGTKHMDIGLDVGFVQQVFVDLEPVHPLDEQLGLFIVHFGHFQNHGHGAHPEEVAGPVFGVQIRTAGQQDPQHATAGHGFVDEVDGLLLDQHQGKDHFWKQIGVHDGQDGNNSGNIFGGNRTVRMG